MVWNATEPGRLRIAAGTAPTWATSAGVAAEVRLRVGIAGFEFMTGGGASLRPRFTRELAVVVRKKLQQPEPMATFLGSILFKS